MPTIPTKAAQTPKVMRIGMAFGKRLRRPSDQLRSARIMIAEIRRMAIALPFSMLTILRSAI